MENAYDPNLQIEVERFLSKAALVEGHTLLDANIGMFNNFNADAQFVSANYVVSPIIVTIHCGF